MRHFNMFILTYCTGLVMTVIVSNKVIDQYFTNKGYPKKEPQTQAHKK
jgi:hypothetical protein